MAPDRAFLPGLALVTGASSGIGRALAYEFARHKHPVALVGRDAAELAKTEARCRELGSPRAHVLARDLAEAGAATALFADLAARGLHVDILVNNAGSGAHGEFAETPLETELAIVRVQVEGTLELTKRFLAQLRRGEPGRKHAILNVSSVYAYAPVPYQAVYGAAKAFMLSFSEALAYELRPSGTTITVLCPGSTRTEFRVRANAGQPSGCPPEDVARAGYHALMRGQFVCVPGLHNRAYTTIMNHLPHVIRARLVQMINGRRGLKPHSR
jgi:short-subunit dehydrogenase